MATAAAKGMPPSSEFAAGLECWCTGSSAEGQCSCVGGRRSITRDRGCGEDGPSCCCPKQRSCDGRLASGHGLYIGNHGMPELESARRNNSSESPVSSMLDTLRNREQDTSSTVTVGRDADTSFFRSGVDSLASDNISQEDGALSGDEDLGRVSSHGWGYVQGKNELKNKTVCGMHKLCWTQEQCSQGLSGPLPSQNLDDERSQTLISSLEQAIALLGLNLGDASSIEDLNSLNTRVHEPKMHSTTPTATEISPRSSEGAPNEAELTGKCLDMAKLIRPLRFPTPCTMQSTYNDPYISPLETEQEYRSTITDYINGSDSTHLSNGSVDISHSAGWRSSKIKFPSMHSSKKSQIYGQRSTGGGVPSVSMSDWDIYEAGIHVKQTPNFSESDGVFEEFVRDQETYFTPPLVLAGDAWDPMDNGTPFDCIFSDSYRPYANNETAWAEIRPSQGYNPSIPTIQDVGVQVYSRELESKEMSTLRDRTDGKSTGLGARLLTALKSKRLRPWLPLKRGLHTEPLPTTNDRAWGQGTQQRTPSSGSESVRTMVSVVMQGCGFQAQLKRLIPRRFTDTVPRSEILGAGTGSNCQSKPDSCDIYCLEPSRISRPERPRIDPFCTQHSIIREEPHSGVDLTHAEVGKQLRRIWT